MPESHIVTTRNFFYPNVTPTHKNKDENVVISGMQKLECHENVEISLGTPKRDGGVARNIQQLARIKPAPTVVWYSIHQKEL